MDHKLELREWARKRVAKAQQILHSNDSSKEKLAQLTALLKDKP